MLRSSLWGLAGAVALAMAPGSALALPNCAGLAAIAMTSPGTQSVTAVVQPAAGSNVAYCRVAVHYIRDINIVVGLPLSAADGGTGGVQGAWNGKIRNIGGGGSVGSPPAINAGPNNRYVGSSTDTGHNPGSCALLGHPNCDPGGYSFFLDASNNIIPQALDDFGWISEIEQVRWAKRLSKLYYGMQQVRNYWDGCSTGGRQGMEMAQKYGDQFDGIYAGTPAFNFGRFSLAALHIGAAIQSYVGDAGISTAKVNAANAAAIQACDGIDGVVDGIISEPRRCNYSAQALKCTGSPSDPATCLTQVEANLIDKVWEGPRNARGQKLWDGPTRGHTTWTGVTSGPSGVLNQPASIPKNAISNFLYQDPAWDYHVLNLSNYVQKFQEVDIKAKTWQADNPRLDLVKNAGTKVLTWHGGGDQLIFPFQSFTYWTRVFAEYGGPANVDPFYRAFFFPGVAHCGGNSVPQPPDMFQALVDWVESGVAPDYLVATQTGATPRTRKACKYPNEAVYNGSGSVDDHANWHCKVNLTEPAELAANQVQAKRINQVP
jgi:hypothetical protein